MKSRAFIILLFIILLTTCTKESPGVYDNFIGTWYISAAYKDGKSANWLPTIIAFDPCVKNSNITFSINQIFNTQSSCDGGTTHGTYEVVGDSIFATDSTKTEIFLFEDSCLIKNVEFHDIPILGDFVCNLEFKKSL